MHFQVSWTSAKAICKSQFDGDLVKIESAEENEHVRRLLPRSSGEYWIGLEDRDVEGAFVWVDNTALGADSAYLNWAPGQPASAASNPSDCVYLRGSTPSSRDPLRQIGS